jgi:hypothetical protein
MISPDLDGRIQGVEELEAGGALARLDHRVRQLHRAGAAQREVLALHRVVGACTACVCVCVRGGGGQARADSEEPGKKERWRALGAHRLRRARPRASAGASASARALACWAAQARPGSRARAAELLLGGRVGQAPAASAASFTAAISASVSVAKRLMATTQGTPYSCTFCRPGAGAGMGQVRHIPMAQVLLVRIIGAPSQAPRRWLWEASKWRQRPPHIHRGVAWGGA